MDILILLSRKMKAETLLGVAGGEGEGTIFDRRSLWH